MVWRRRLCDRLSCYEDLSGVSDSGGRPAERLSPFWMLVALLWPKLKGVMHSFGIDEEWVAEYTETCHVEVAGVETTLLFCLGCWILGLALIFTRRRLLRNLIYMWLTAAVFTLIFTRAQLMTLPASLGTKVSELREAYNIEAQDVHNASAVLCLSGSVVVVGLAFNLGLVSKVFWVIKYFVAFLLGYMFSHILPQLLGLLGQFESTKFQFVLPTIWFVADGDDTLVFLMVAILMTGGLLSRYVGNWAVVATGLWIGSYPAWRHVLDEYKIDHAIVEDSFSKQQVTAEVVFKICGVVFGIMMCGILDEKILERGVAILLGAVIFSVGADVALSEANNLDPLHLGQAVVLVATIAGYAEYWRQNVPPDTIRTGKAVTHVCQSVHQSPALTRGRSSTGDQGQQGGILQNPLGTPPRHSRGRNAAKTRSQLAAGEGSPGLIARLFKNSPSPNPDGRESNSGATPAKATSGKADDGAKASKAPGKGSKKKGRPAEDTKGKGKAPPSVPEPPTKGWLW